jgi:hypothetical protein
MTMTQYFAVLFTLQRGCCWPAYRIVLCAHSAIKNSCDTCAAAPRVLLLLITKVYSLKVSSSNFMDLAVQRLSAVALVLWHLRYFIDPVWSWVIFIQPFGIIRFA